MTEASARKSYDAWVKQGSKPLPVLTPAETDAEIALRRIQIDSLMADFGCETAAAIAWFRKWKARQPKGFRATRAENQFSRAG